MKKMISNIKSLAALLMAGAAFTACSSSDDNIIEQPVQPTEPQVYTLVIEASKGDDATTRALSGGNGSVSARWDGTETIDVVQDNGTTKTKIGTATAAANVDGGSTTITATLNSEPTGDLHFVLGGTTFDYTGQNGILASVPSIDDHYISKDHDFAVAQLAADDYTKEGTVITPKTGVKLDFESNQAIVKFTLLDKADGTTELNPSSLTIHVSNDNLYQSYDYLTETATYGDITINPKHSTNKIYASLCGVGVGTTVTLTAIVGDDTYTYEKSGVTFTRDKYYEITVKMTKNENARPLTLEAIEDGTITVEFCNGLTLPKPITYTKNGGAGVDITSTTNIPVSAGDKVCLYSKNSDLGYYTEEGGTKYDYYIHIQTSNRCYIYGNVMSLIDDSGSGFANDKVIADNTAEQHTTFYRLFEDAEFLENHPTKPILLPATTLAMDCYSEMFSFCRSLTTAPELPAETLADGCYVAMFLQCTSLTTAPELPATTLADNCYAAMFSFCTSLTTAPMLPATTLAGSCYNMMFQGCTNLNYVKCLATDISADYCLDWWLDGVSASGTFVKASGATWAVAGTNGIPSGWTVNEE